MSNPCCFRKRPETECDFLIIPSQTNPSRFISCHIVMSVRLRIDLFYVRWNNSVLYGRIFVKIYTRNVQRHLSIKLLSE